MTEKLYYENLYQKESDAHVVRRETRDGKELVVLDRTVLFPGGGGQPCDRGWLNEIPTEQVYEENGEIIHVLSQPLPADCENVHVKLDWDYRFEMMQIHLGQHILSAVFVRDFDRNTESIHLEQNEQYIDLDGFVNEEALAKAEAASNEIIYDDIPVEILYPSLEEIRRNSKRPIPETDEAIRIVKIGDLDYTPCCGLQNGRTGEVGLIKILHLDSHKTGSRIHFLCGRPAYRWLSALYGQTSELMKAFGCRQEDLNDRILKQQAEVQELKDEKKSLLGRLASAEASAMVSGAQQINGIALIQKVLKDTSQDEVRQLFEQLAAEKGRVVLLGGSTKDGAFLLFGCHKSEKRVDVRKAFQAAIAALDGKGGGSACRAQGFAPSAAALEQAMAEAARIMQEQLQALA